LRGSRRPQTARYSEIDPATNNIVLSTVGVENKTRVLVAAEDVKDPAALARS
jgi:hypothetical protein